MRSKMVMVTLLLLAAALVAPPAHADEWVTKLQRRLNHLGCNAGPADGKYGDWTRSAVVRFQSRRRLAMDGVAFTGELLDAGREWLRLDPSMDRVIAAALLEVVESASTGLDVAAAALLRNKLPQHRQFIRMIRQM